MAGRDRISQLPEHILQNILLLLSWEDAAHTSVLSKTWKDLWSTFPVFNFNFDQKLKRKLKLQEETEDFINVVDQALLNVQSENAIIPKFRLCMHFMDPKNASHIDGWIDLATKNCLRELDLEILFDMPELWYCLPPTTFAAKTLEVLRLQRCKLEKPLFAGSKNFCCLREVCLVLVRLDDECLKDFMFGCPALEDFALTECFGLKSLLIPCLPKLQRLMVHHTKKVKRTDIEAINLQSFHYRGYYGKLNISAPTLKYLRELNLEYICFTDDLFEDLISKLPLLQNLALTSCIGLTRVKISHCFLEKLHLWLTGLLVLEIETPILLSFKYNADRLPDRFSINAPSLQESYFILYIGSSVCLDSHWFLTLRAYLSQFNQHSVVDIFRFEPARHSEFVKTITFIPDELNEMEIPPLPVVKQLKLETVCSSSNFQGLLDGLLWSCHPETLLVKRASIKGKAKFIRFLCEKLIDRVEDPLCCMYSRIRCWRHYIEDVRTEGLMTAEDRKVFLSSLPKRIGDPVPCPDICFQLKWHTSIEQSLLL